MTTQRTFTAPILLPGDPSLALQAATKQYCDLKVGSVAATDSTITVAGSATSPTVAVNAIAESQVTGLVTDLAAKAPTASPTFTGTLTTPRIITPPVTLSDAATILVDASLGNTFTFTVITTGRAVGAPSNPTDTQKILFRLRQDGTGSKTLTWNAAYSFGSDITAAPTLSTAANKVDYVGFIYDSTNSKWHLLSYVRGY